MSPGFCEKGEREMAKRELAHVGNAFDEDAASWHMDVDAYASIRSGLGLQ